MLHSTNQNYDVCHSYIFIFISLFSLHMQLMPRGSLLQYAMSLLYDSTLRP